MQKQSITIDHSPIYYIVRPLYYAGLALVAFSAFLLFTEYGANTAFSLFSEFSNVTLSTKHFSGSLLGGFTAQDIKIIHDTNTLTIHNLSINWNPFAIFKKTLHITNFTANDINLFRTKENTKFDPNALSLNKIQQSIKNITPFEIKIDTGNVQNLTMTVNNKILTIQALSLSKFNTYQPMDLQALNLHSDYGTIIADLKKNISLKWKIHISKIDLPELFSGKLQSEGEVFIPKTSEQTLKNSKINIKLTLSDETKTNQNALKTLYFTTTGDTLAHVVSLSLETNKYTLNSKIQGHYTSDHWNAKIINAHFVDKVRGDLPKSSGNISLDYKHDGIYVKTQLQLFGNNRIQSTAKIMSTKPYLLVGNIKGNFTTLQFLTKLYPNITQLTGKAEMNLAIAGNLTAPLITGQAKLTSVQFHHTELNPTAYIESLTLHSKANGLITLLGEGTLGGGPFYISGNTNIQNSPLQLDLKFSGNNLVISDTTEYYIVVSPELRLKMNHGAPHLTGNLFIPKADINAPIIRTHIPPSEDVIFIKNNQPIVQQYASENFGQQLYTDLSIELGEEIRFTGFNLDTHIAGKLQITSRPHQIPTGTGKLHLINGKYKIYGKTLQVNYGQILFTGAPINEPTLDIHGERVIETQKNKNLSPITVGINITGTLKSPIVNMYSTPNMPDSDVISYLILGQPQNKASLAQNQVLFQAASELADFLGKKNTRHKIDLGAKLKFDEFGLTTQTQNIPGEHSPLEETVFVLGKQLSKRLYLHYSVGLANSVSNLGARYQVNKHVTLQATGGNTTTGADLLLNFESS